MAKTMDQPSIYLAEYSAFTDKLSSGKDAVDMICEFWEKLAYIEYNYAKSIAQLCNSRHGKLFKMFNDKPSEYFRPLQSVWGAVLEDLLTHSESHLNVAYTLQREVKPALNSFSQDDLTKQMEVAMHGKKVMTGLKEDLSKLEGERKKVYKAMLSENAEEMKEMSDDIKDNQSKTKQLQKLWIRSKDSHAHAFNVTMPSIIEELNNTSVRRVEAVCNSVGHFASLVTSTGSTFATTSSTLLAAQSASQSVRYTMTCETPEPPGDLHLNMTRAEMIEYCQTPAKKFFNNIQEKVFPANVGSMFVNPARNMNRSNSASSEGDLHSPLKDISHKLGTMWSNIRTRSFSGNTSDLLPQEDLDTADDALLDPEDVDILDPGLVRGIAALEDQSSTTEDPNPPQAAEKTSLSEAPLSSEGHVPSEVQVASEQRTQTTEESILTEQIIDLTDVPPVDHVSSEIPPLTSSQTEQSIQPAEEALQTDLLLDQEAEEAFATEPLTHLAEEALITDSLAKPTEEALITDPFVQPAEEALPTEPLAQLAEEALQTEDTITQGEDELVEVGIEPVKEEEELREQDMLVSLSNDPDATEEYVVVNE